MGYLRYNSLSCYVPQFNLTYWAAFFSVFYLSTYHQIPSFFVYLFIYFLFYIFFFIFSSLLWFLHKFVLISLLVASAGSVAGGGYYPPDSNGNSNYNNSNSSFNFNNSNYNNNNENNNNNNNNNLQTLEERRGN